MPRGTLFLLHIFSFPTCNNNEKTDEVKNYIRRNKNKSFEHLNYQAMIRCESGSLHVHINT